MGNDMLYRSPEDYDFRYLSLGAGVQSSTLVEMMVEGELAPVDVAIFADTRDEPSYVYSHVEYLHGRLKRIGVPLVTVTRGDLVADLSSPDERFAAIPAYTVVDGKKGQLRRQCTREYKIERIEHWVRRELLRRGLAKQRSNRAVYVNKEVRVQCLLGLSLDEYHRMQHNPVGWIDSAWPLVHRRLRRHECILWLQDHDLPVPGKSSCRICPYHSAAYWRAMRDDRPDDWMHVTKMDAFLRSGQARFSATAKGPLYLHRDCTPLAEVDFSLDDTQMDFCESGFCFT